MKLLEKRTGIPVKWVETTDSRRVQRPCVRGVFTYLLAHEVANAEPVTTFVFRDTGRSTYLSYILTRPDTGIKPIEDLRGRNVALLDPGSTYGDFFPMYLIKKAGMVPERDLGNITYGGSSTSNGLALKDKKIHACSTNDIAVKRMVEKGLINMKDFVIVAQAECPPPPFTVRGDLPKDLKEKIKQAFLEIGLTKHKMQVKSQGDVTLYREVRDSMCEQLRDLGKTPGIDLKNIKTSNIY